MKIRKILLSSILIVFLFLIVITPRKNPGTLLGVEGGLEKPQSDSADSVSFLDDFLQVAIDQNSEWCRAHREEIKQQYLLPVFPNYFQKLSSVSGTSYEGHEPIFIDDDTDFSALDFPGNGTSDSPYEITGWNITNSSEILIHIENTTAYFQIHDNLLNGTNRNHDAIFLKNVTHGVITHNTIHNSLCGISLNFSPGNSLSENIIHDNENQGILLAISSDGNEISSNTIYNHNASGIFISRSNDVTIFNNTAFKNGYAVVLDPKSLASDITLVKSSGAVVSSNTAKNSYDYGIGLWSANDIVVSNNFVYNNTADGILISMTSTNNTITSNLVYENKEDGISLNNSNYNIISNNEIHNNGGNPGGNGLYADPSNHNIIFNNSIFNNSLNGIFLNSSENNVLSSNDVFYNHEDGVFLYNSSNNLLLENLIHNNGVNPGGNGLYADPSNRNVIFNNTIFENDENGIFLNSSEYSIISDNNVSYNHEDGVFLYHSCFNAISNNLIHNNGGNPGGNGLYADPSDHNVINSNYIFANSINGIYLHRGKNNTVFGNKLENNAQFGVNISSSSDDNQIKLNDFLNNALEGSVSQARDDGLGNSFDFNYWNDHDNTDIDGDGIADKEYSINGTAGNKDEHPSVTPLIVPPPPSIITITNTTSIVRTREISEIETATVTEQTAGWPIMFLILSIITIISLRRFKRIS